MKRRHKLSSMALVVTLCSSLDAGTWDEMVEQNVRSTLEQDGDYGYKFRAALGPSNYAARKVGKEIEWFDADANLGTRGNSCGGLDFGAQFKAMFNKEALNQYLGEMENLVGGLVAAAPMLLLESVDPQLAEILKHFKAMANMNMTTKMGQCRDLYKAAASAGRKLFNTQKPACFEEMTSSGTDAELAMKECEKATNARLPEWFGVKKSLAEIANDGKPFNITEMALDKFGGGLDKEGKDFARALFGETTFTAEAGVAYKNFKKKLDEVHDEYARDYERSINNVIKAVAANKSLSTVERDLKKITSSFSHDKEFLLMLAALPGSKRKHYTQRLGKLYADEKFLTQKTKDEEEVEKVAEQADADMGQKVAEEADISKKTFGERMKDTKKEVKEKKETENKLSEKSQEQLAEIYADMQYAQARDAQEALLQEQQKANHEEQLVGEWGSILGAKGRQSILNGEYNKTGLSGMGR